MKDWEMFEFCTKQCIDCLLKDNVDFICSGRECKLKAFSGVERQFDILYKYKNVITSDNLLAVECKYWNKNVDVAEITEFAKKCESCKIGNKYICSKIGFTDGAKKEAEFNNIHLIELNNFQKDDFNNFNFIQKVVLNASYILPEVKLSIETILEKENGLEKLPQDISINNDIKIILENDDVVFLSDYFPKNTNEVHNFARKFNFEILSTKEEEKQTTLYEKKFLVKSLIYNNIEYQNIKEIHLRIEEIIDFSKAAKMTTIIDFTDEILEAGYFVAKTLNKRFLINSKKNEFILG